MSWPFRGNGLIAIRGSWIAGCGWIKGDLARQLCPGRTIELNIGHFLAKVLRNLRGRVSVPLRIGFGAYDDCPSVFQPVNTRGRTRRQELLAKLLYKQWTKHVRPEYESHFLDGGEFAFNCVFPRLVDPAIHRPQHRINVLRQRKLPFGHVVNIGQSLANRLTDHDGSKRRKVTQARRSNVQPLRNCEDLARQQIVLKVYWNEY